MKKKMKEKKENRKRKIGWSGWVQLNNKKDERVHENIQKNLCELL